MADIEIEIDGQKLTAQPNQTVIEVADAAGIYIPRFCYHKLLSVAANCRMCLVEVEKSPKTLPACATPVMPGMKVFTKSAKTIEAQRAVMEFLLINHPLDCPICDQGGECELQDLAMGYGSGHSHYDECKRSVADENLGPLVATDMTRCILCTRCVRFGSEIAGLRELGVTNRGGHAEIKTFVEHAMQSEVSGNIIDLCPVGALTSKPYRFTARPWELNQYPSISPHDCMGSNLNVHTRYGQVMRVVTRDNMAINETWLADRDRFSYTSLYHPDRLQQPMARIDGVWQTVEWQKAFELATVSLRNTIAQHGPDKFGALASPSSTVEEFYLLQKLVRGLGSAHIDHRLRQQDTQDQANMPAFPGINMPIAALETCDAVLLIGSNVQKEQPIASLRLRKAALKGAAICVVNPVDYEFNFAVAAQNISAPQHLPRVLAGIINVFTPEYPEVAVDDSMRAMAAALQDKQNVCIALGALALNHPEASTIRYLAQRLAELTQGKLSLLTEGANAAGAWLAGAVPHRHAGGETVNHVGLNAYEMLSKPRKAYILLNVEPADCANAQHAHAALKQADCVIALSMYRDPVIEQCAHIIFPIAPFTETSGSFVNAAGEWQSFKGVAKPFADSRPAWKVLRVFGNFLHLDGFNYESSEEIKHEVRQIVEKMPVSSAHFTKPAHFSLTSHSKLSRIGEVPLYAIDSLVRHAKPLQAAQTIMLGDVETVRLHPDTANKIGVTDGNVVTVKQHAATAQLKVMIDARIAEGGAWIAGGVLASNELGDLFGEVEVKC